jgi:hypothetical protein
MALKLKDLNQEQKIQLLQQLANNVGLMVACNEE